MGQTMAPKSEGWTGRALSRVEIQKEKPPWEHAPGRKPRTVTAELLEIHVDNVEAKTPGDPALGAPRLVWLLLPGSLTGPHSAHGRKIP